jgi:hypothetical protein
MSGAAMEDSMAVDVVLWFILAAMIGLVCCGCLMTLPRRRVEKIPDSGFAQKLDRAA